MGYDFFGNVIEKQSRVCYSSVEGAGFSVTFADYFSDVCECLDLIKEKRPDLTGVHVGLLAENTYEYIVVLGALFMGGAVITPINSYEAQDNVNYIVDNADIEILIVSDIYDGYSAQTTLKVSDIVLRSRKNVYSYDKKMDDSVSEARFLLYTSGTTGRPKGVMHPVSSFLTLVEESYSENEEFNLTFKNGYITVPLYHVMGLFYWLLSFRCGLVMHTNRKIGDMIYELKQIKPDIVIATPAFIKTLEIVQRKPQPNGTENLRFLVSGGAPLSEELVKSLTERRIGLNNVYGMTETAGSGTYNFVDLKHRTSVGRPLPNTDIKIIDGEICITNEYLMEGYYKDPEATAECLIDGYMHTGDLGYIDEEGYVYITGRKKNLIILSGGENISPEEIEALIYANPLVKECIVYEKNDRLAAKIFSPQSTEADIKSFVDELNKKLPLFKKIYSVDVADEELEKTGSGKIKR